MIAQINDGKLEGRRRERGSVKREMIRRWIACDFDYRNDRNRLVLLYSATIIRKMWKFSFGLLETGAASVAVESKSIFNRSP